jgi:hypothetical protein
MQSPIHGKKGKVFVPSEGSSVSRELRPQDSRKEAEPPWPPFAAEPRAECAGPGRKVKISLGDFFWTLAAPSGGNATG